MKKDFANRRLQKIVQRLKSVILQDLSGAERVRLKAELANLDKKYTTGALEFEQYKLKAVVLLCRGLGVAWTEQFLYRETGSFYTQAEKFEICQQVEAEE
jgi:hypothetical protein